MKFFYFFIALTLAVRSYAFSSSCISEIDITIIEELSVKVVKEFDESKDVKSLVAALSVMNSASLTDLNSPCTHLMNMYNTVDVVHASSLSKCQHYSDDSQIQTKLSSLNPSENNAAVKAALVSNLSLIETSSLVQMIKRRFGMNQDISNLILNIDMLADLLPLMSKSDKDSIMKPLKGVINWLVDSQKNTEQYVSLGSGAEDTSRFILSLLRLSVEFDSDFGVSEEFVDKVTQSIAASAKFVKSIIAGEAILKALHSLASRSENTYGLPICITATSLSFYVENPQSLSVTVTDTLGKFVDGSATLVFIQNDKTSKEIPSNLAFEPNTEGNTFDADFMSAIKSKPGIYSIELSFEPSDSDFNRLDHVEQSQKLVVTKSGANLLTDISIDVGGIVRKVEYPDVIDSVLNLDGMKMVTTTFTLTQKVHQTFVRFKKKDLNFESFFCAQLDKVATKQADEGQFIYSVLIDIGTAEGEIFKYNSGEYSIALILGDLTLDMGYEFEVASAVLSLDSPPAKETYPLYKKTLLHDSDIAMEALPTIEHQFRQPEKRPSEFVSNIFTLITLLPLPVFLIVAFTVVGINVDGIPRGFGFIWFFLFHGATGSILFLIVKYWIHLSLLETLRYMFPLLCISCVSGYYLLRTLALANYTNTITSPKQKKD